MHTMKAYRTDLHSEVLTAYKYRLYPTKAQVVNLELTRVACQRLYNELLETSIKSYRENKLTLNWVDLINLIKTSTVPDLHLVHSQVKQDVAIRLYKAMQNFFRRLKTGGAPGFPRFKAVDRYASFTYPQSGFSLSLLAKSKFCTAKLKLSKIGTVPVKYHRSIRGLIKTCTIVKDGNGLWYTCFSVRQTKMVVNKILDLDNHLGIDVGCKHLVNGSDGSAVAAPKFYIKALDTLALMQAQLANKRTELQKANVPVRADARYLKLKRRISRKHQQIVHQRDDFLHKLSAETVLNNDVISVEDLNIKDMTKDNFKTLNRSILDASWGKFISYLTYKAEKAGKLVVPVDPNYTSQLCSRCGSIRKLSLSERVYNCESCGLTIDRDYNSSINIKKRGIEHINIMLSKRQLCLISDTRQCI